MKPLPRKIRNGLIGALVALCFAAPLGYAAFSTTWTAQFSGTTTSSSSAAQVKTAAWLNASITTHVHDASNFLGTCLINQQDRQSFTCSQSTIGVGENATITAILTNTGNTNESITPLVLSTNTSAFVVVPVGNVSAMIPVGKSATFVYLVKCVAEGSATIEGGIGG